MKVFRYLIAACLVLGLTGVANATIFRVLDPTGPEGSLPPINLNGPNDFSLYTCTAFSAASCFGAFNPLPQTLSLASFTASLTANPGVDLGTPDCPTGTFDSVDSAFSANITCTVTGDITTGETLNVVFTDGSVAQGGNLWIVSDDLAPGDFAADAGMFTVTVTPEPSSIWMALTGLGSFGYVVRRRRKVAL
jgi:hypothetical protein